ncbi:MAG TPA: hypothetical protein VGQ71_06220 [Terriglobales bacterium]|jgi:chromosome segregation ATPase|nr:hypothetical protein [Terriglobales bacterium]
MHNRKPIIAAIMVALLWVPVEAQKQPSLAEVARQKPAKKAKRVITDDDLPQRPPEASVSPATNAPAAEQAPAKPPEEALKEARERLDTLKQDEEKLQRGYDDLQDRYSKETDSFRRTVLANELQNSKENIATVKKLREAAEKELAGLEPQKPKAEAKESAPSSSPTPAKD